MSRHLGSLTEDEWDTLLNEFADRVLFPLNVAGSLAGVYSLYTVLDKEYRRARRDNDVLRDIALADQP